MGHGIQESVIHGSMIRGFRRSINWLKVRRPGLALKKIRNGYDNKRRSIKTGRSTYVRNRPLSKLLIQPEQSFSLDNTTITAILAQLAQLTEAMTAMKRSRPSSPTPPTPSSQPTQSEQLEQPVQEQSNSENTAESTSKKTRKKSRRKKGTTQKNCTTGNSSNDNCPQMRLILGHSAIRLRFMDSILFMHAILAMRT